MTVQLARAFLDFLCLTVTLNLGQTCNEDLRTKNKVYIADVHTLVAVCGCGVERNCFRRFDIRATEKREKFVLPR